MKNLKEYIIKTTINSIVFSIIFISLIIISFKTWAALSNVNPGEPLSATNWNGLISNLFWQNYGSNIYYTSGNVGIGTTLPSSSLSVKGTNTVLTLEGTTPQIGINYVYNSQNTARITVDNDTTNQHTMRFFTFNNLDTPKLKEKMVIMGDGKIGIGTTNPNEKLEVNGNIIGAPIFGRWRATNENNNTTTPDNYIWGIELSNNYSTYFSRSADKKSIIFNKAGVYLVVANVLQRTTTSRCDAYMKINNTTFSLSLSPDNNTGYYKHHFSEIINANVGDYVNIYSNSNSICKLYSSNDGRNTLSIYKLN